MALEITIKYGGADGSCKNVTAYGGPVNIKTIIDMIEFAKTKGVKNVCIRDFHFDAILEDLRGHLKPGE